MSISDSEFPSSAIFESIRVGLDKDAAFKKKLIKQTNSVVQFDLKNKEGKTQSWYLEGKKEGKIVKGKPEKTADITLIVTDDNFKQLIDGKANAQKLYMSGKLKVKGNVMKAASIEGVLKSAKSRAKL